MGNLITKPTFEEYSDWALKNCGVDFNGKTQIDTYMINARVAQTQAQESQFMTGLSSFLSKCDEEYKSHYKSDLLMKDETQIEFSWKPYNSLVDKSYRLNIIQNKEFPAPPRWDTDSYWLTPQNWYPHINDLLRTRIVCKYIDGPKFLAERLIEYANSSGIQCSSKSQQKDGGYYAYHFYAKLPVKLLINKEPMDIALETEIQIATQLQEVLDKLTHPYYEKQRIAPPEDSDAWKWEYNTSEFMARYMGHTLHMLEAIIVDIRNKTNIQASSVNQEEVAKEN
jgi:ppGpp synthetase/RelA/SpoT-type nucleotidyltranferase